MARKDRPNLSRFELEIMEILWEQGESSVREVQEAVHERKRPAYTTVQTIFARLEEKKAVRRTRKIGNAFLFEPLLTRRSVYRRLIDDFLNLFGGSAQPVLTHLVETGKLSLEDLTALEQASKAVQQEGQPAERKGKRR